jgi:circadian clock protein KaiB
MSGQDDDEVDDADALERSLAQARHAKIVLKLFVSGLTANSTRAIADLNRLCNERLRGRCQVEVIDIYQQPELAIEAQVVALPTLIKVSPPPERRLIGSLAETQRVLKSLALPS